ncbi:MAG: hypothetical protein D3923_14425, partial [Candidatus Electrothrix sp. AR3]|nr:hypothetical protein [Candidatus Electrothrix sp. AR3]
LRREGIGFIEEMGSRLWTDYNTHDPGITILEALCYAITDLAYRTGWDIEDILAPPTPSPDPDEPFPNQPFFTAREILTVNPLTPEDFRRLLIDLDTVRNAWVVRKQCACETGYYARCEKDQLALSYRKNGNNEKPVEPLGLYDVLLELEADPELGDLNNRKIERSLIFSEDISFDESALHQFKMEVRFPELSFDCREEWKLFFDVPCNIELLKLGATKFYNVFKDEELDEAGRDKYLRDKWSDVFYVTLNIAFPNFEISDTVIRIENASLRIFGDTFVKNKTTFADIKNNLEDTTSDGFILRYSNKLDKVEAAVAEAKKTLHQHRNLDEDYCCVRGVDVEDVSVCADVELTPDADIERVQARIWFEIEQYFNPPVPFYSLQELMSAEIPIEDIFNGPQLNNGFIKAEELEAADLKTELRTSDIINRLMDIDGVISVNNLLLSHYDAEGKVIKGRVDPTWHNGTPLFNTDKSSAEWILFVSPLHQPRLYHSQSRFLFFKNGLPFKPRMDEARDTLTQLRG